MNIRNKILGLMDSKIISEDIITQFNKLVKRLNETDKKILLDLTRRRKMNNKSIFLTQLMKKIAETDFNYVMDTIEKDGLNEKPLHWLRGRFKIGMPYYVLELLSERTGDEKIIFISHFFKNLDKFVPKILDTIEEAIDQKNIESLLQNLIFRADIPDKTVVKLVSMLRTSYLESILYDVEIGLPARHSKIMFAAIPNLCLQKRIAYFDNLPKTTLEQWKSNRYPFYLKLLKAVTLNERLEKQDWEIDDMDSEKENNVKYGETPDDIIRTFMNRNIETLFLAKRGDYFRYDTIQQREFIETMYEFYPGAFTYGMLMGINPDDRSLSDIRSHIHEKILMEN